MSDPLTRRADGPRRRTAALALGLLIAASPAAAEEWHEAYRAGVSALARGDAARAVERLRRAIALRPEPGRNVVTYGTNIEPRYFPYLKLAEAHLALGQLEAAQTVLGSSQTWGREPPEERIRLEERLAAAFDARRPRRAAPSPTPPPLTPAPTPSPAPTPAESATPAPAMPFAPSTTAPPPGPRPIGARDTREPASPAAGPANARRSPPPAAPAAAPADSTTASLEIFSEPAGASAYVDDELVGSTDPKTGRLVKADLPSGRRRVRVALSGHEDAVREIEVPRGGVVTFYATLKPVSAPSPGPPWGIVAFAAVALALIGVIAWMALRRPAHGPAIWAHTPRSGRTGDGSPTPPTPPGLVNPGARRDERGEEWFGEYRLIELLGRGGMASVYKASRRNELLALKRPLGSLLDDPEFLERFLREAEISRALNHPNIVRILERGEVERVPYFSMELLAGETLQGFIRSWGAAEPRTAAQVVAQVAEALDFAHSKGVVHRDLKPSNIMLLLDGTAKVMDFGIARARRFGGMTTTGGFLGTPDYVAPETIEGGVTEPRSDLYALGAVFYELLTGRRPFTGDTAFAILQKHCREEPPPPSQLDKRVPAELEALVLRLLRKAPSERPASAEELVVALRDWLNRAA